MRTLEARSSEDRCLPRDPHGQIISPRYLPKNSAYLKTWREWCKATPKDQWPQWLHEDVRTLRVQNSTRSSGESMPSTQT